MEASSSSVGKSREVNPGPENPSLLKFQSVHVSETVWNGRPDRILKCRRALVFRGGRGSVPDQIVPHLQRAGFLGIAQLHFFQVEPALVSALVERWRPETHTFHMPPGECTITLQDVAIQTGLRVDGLPLMIDSSDQDWSACVQNLFGVYPPDDVFHSGTLKMKWISEHFDNIDDHLGDEVQLLRFARAYILRLIGGVIFSDQSSSRVPLRYLPLLEDLDRCGQYSWGSAALSYLYRELCKSTDYDRSSICGLHLLVQVWAWDRFPCIAPTVPPQGRPAGTPYAARWLGSGTFKAVRQDIDFYRRSFDLMKRTDIVWTPYGADVLQSLPAICLQGSEAWRAVVPLLCTNIVEWHQPDRVMRQFGMQQHILSAPRQPEDLHGITQRGKSGENWGQLYMPLITMWVNRVEYMYTNPPLDGLLSANSEYMRWYTLHTRRWIARKNAVVGCSVDEVETIHYLATEDAQMQARSSTSVFDQIRQHSVNVMQMVGEEDRILQSMAMAPVRQNEAPNEPFHINMPGGRNEREGIVRGRSHEDHQLYSLPTLPAREQGMYYVPTQIGQASPWSTYQFPSQPFDDSQQFPFESYQTPLYSNTNVGVGGLGSGYAPSPPQSPTPFVRDLATPNTPLVTHREGPNTHGVDARLNLGMDLFGTGTSVDFGADVGVEDDSIPALELRRNPHRHVRDLGFRCILSPEDHQRRR